MLKFNMRFTTFAFFWLLLSSNLFSDSLTEAVQAYDKGDFQKSVSLYEEMLQKGIHNGSIYYNLGNSYFRMGEKGKAISAYLAARRLLPRDPDVKANLKFAHDQMVDKLGLRSSSSIVRDFCFWVDHTTPREVLLFSSLLACLGLTILFLSLVMFKFMYLRVWSLVLSFLACLGFFMFATSLYYEEVWGAVSVPISEVRSGPGTQNTVVFQLHEGAPVLVEAKEGGWYRISLSDSKIGWISSQDLSVILF